MPAGAARAVPSGEMPPVPVARDSNVWCMRPATGTREWHATFITVFPVRRRYSYGQVEVCHGQRHACCPADVRHGIVGKGLPAAAGKRGAFR